MRHRKASLKLNRTTSHRLAMFRNMVTSLFKHERIKTTGAKAKELRRLADQVITLAKRGDLHARRQALAIVREKRVVHKLFEEANEKFGHSAGGYTRVVKLGRRSGDAAQMSLVELVVPAAAGKKKSKKKSAKPGAVKKAAESGKKAETDAKKEKKKASKKEEATKPKKAPRKKAVTKKDEPKAKAGAKKKSAAAEKETTSEDKPKKASKPKAEKSS